MSCLRRDDSKWPQPAMQSGQAPTRCTGGNRRQPPSRSGGESSQWFYDLLAVTKMLNFPRERGQQVEALVGEVPLESGETFQPSPLPASHLP